MKSLPKLLLMAAVLALVGCSLPNSANEKKLAVAKEMVKAWNERNWDHVYELFAEEGVLHSMMMEPIVGRETIRAHLSPLTSGIDKIELRIRNIGVVGDVVMLERVDDFVYKGKHGSVPVVGVMKIADGKVKEWREYYDYASLARALAPEPKPEAEVQAEAEKQIVALTGKLQSDWNGGDMSAYLDAYWKDDGLSVMFGDQAVRGWQALSDLYTSSFRTEKQMGDFKTKDVVVRFPRPDIAIASGGFEHQFPDQPLIVGAFSHVWRHFDDGRWRIVHEHTSRAVKH